MKRSLAPRTALSLAASAALLVLTAVPVLAGDEAGAPASQGTGPGQALAGVGLGVLLVVGLGCLLAVLRIIFPGPARKADAALERLSTGRLLLTGLLPVVGIGLLGAAAEATHVEALVVVWVVALLLPAALLMIVGALAAVPHLGAGLLRSRDDRSLLARSVVGALVLGLALGASAALGPLVHFVGMIVAGWFLGAGLGVIFRPASPRAAGAGDGVDGESPGGPAADE